MYFLYSSSGRFDVGPGFGVFITRDVEEEDDFQLGAGSYRVS